jgi:hypothetical protein
MPETAAQIHLLVVTLHAFAASVSLVAGVLAVLAGRGFRLHVIALVVMALALAPSLVLGWPTFAPPARVAFTGLAGLAVVMIGQAVRAARVRRAEVVRGVGRLGPEFVGVLGFNLIALTVAGTVVPVLRLDAGVVGVALSVVVTVVGGHLLVARRVRQVSATRGGQEEDESGNSRVRYQALRSP